MGARFGRNVINDQCFACKGDVRGGRIGLDPTEARDFRTLIVGVASAFIDVGEVDITIGGEVGIEGKAQEAVIEILVDVIANVEKGSGKQLAIFNDADFTSFLPNKDASIRGKGEADRRIRRQSSHSLGIKAGIDKGDLCVRRNRRYGCAEDG